MIKVDLSICIVTLNDRVNLTSTLNSLDYSPNIEIIIQDGGSDYDLNEVIADFPAIASLIKLEVKRDFGIYDAMNKAVARCSGDFVIFLNCGDSLATGMQDLLLDILTRIPSEIRCVKFLAFVNGEGVNVERASCFYFFRRMLNHQSLVYRRTVFSEVCFDTSLRIVGDLKHFLEANLSHYILYIDLILIDYLNGGTAAISSGIRQNWKERAYSWSWRTSLCQRVVLMLGVLLRYFLHFTKLKKF